MATTWRVEGAQGMWLVRGDAPTAAALGGQPLRGEDAASRVDAWFPEGRGRDMAVTLASICEAIPMARPSPSSAWPDQERMRETLRRALQGGRVTAVKVGLAPPSGWVEDDAVVGHERVVREETTWIEIVLVGDEDPPQPIPYAKYRVELPDGSTREGILSDQGRARFDGIDSGACKVTFPDFDGRDWR